MKYLTAERLINFLKQVDPNTLIVLEGYDHSFNYANAMIAYAERDADGFLFESIDSTTGFDVVVIN